MKKVEKESKEIKREGNKKPDTGKNEGKKRN